MQDSSCKSKIQAGLHHELSVTAFIGADEHGSPALSFAYRGEHDQCTLPKLGAGNHVPNKRARANYLQAVSVLANCGVNCVALAARHNQRL